MVPSIQASTQARDITLDLQNSCNCCWFSNRQNPQTQIYVNSLGMAEKYDPKKAVDREVALRRAVENLTRVIEYNASLAHKEIEVIQTKVVEAVGNPLDEVDGKPNSLRGLLSLSNNATWPITVDLIQKVNAVMKENF